jgi:hypothetical protein
MLSANWLACRMPPICCHLKPRRSPCLHARTYTS